MIARTLAIDPETSGVLSSLCLPAEARDSTRIIFLRLLTASNAGSVGWHHRFLEPIDTAGLDTGDEAACRAVYEDVRGAVQAGMAALQARKAGLLKALENSPRRMNMQDIH